MSRIKDKPGSNYVLSIFMMGALFFVFGLVSWVNSILVPYFRIACDLHTQVQSYLVTFAFYIAYLVMTIPASVLLNRTGLKRGVEIGLWILALGALAFIPAALTRSFPAFLTGLFIMGTGLAILQTAANPFVTIIGPIESAARRISIMGVCNKFAGIVSPLIFAALVMHESDKEVMAQIGNGTLTGTFKEAALDNLIRSVIPPYAVLAFLLIVFGVVFYHSSIPDIDPNTANKSTDDRGKRSRKSVFSYPYLILGVLAIMVHVGSQQISIATCINYAGSMGIGLDAAKILPSITLGCILIGYLLGIVCIPKFISQQKALLVCTITGLALSLLVALTSGTVRFFGLDMDVSLVFLLLLGIPNSLIYAGIWPLAIRNLGKFTNLGSSLLVMGLCGNAILPLVYGAIADGSSLKTAYWVLVPCFLYLVFYALWGYKIEHWKKYETAEDIQCKDRQ